MTISEHIGNLQEKVKEIEARQLLAAATAHAAMTDRIFVRGERADGGKIGAYESTKPLYVNPKNMPSRKNNNPEGKAGGKKFKNGEAHKTRFYSSYKDYKGQQGRESAFVNLVLFGNLERDFSKPPIKEGDSFKSGFSQQINTDKYHGITKKYGDDIFKLSDEERQIYINALLRNA